MSETVSAQEVREAMEANGITYVEHHDCSLCGYMTNYFVQDGTLYFDSGCDCVTHRRTREVDYQQAADWINMQANPAIRIKIAARFGVSLMVDPPLPGAP